MKIDEWNLLEMLVDLRSNMYTGESEKQKEILNKLDELILKALNAIKTVEE